MRLLYKNVVMFATMAALTLYYVAFVAQAKASIGDRDLPEELK